jgi:hypothetical protein
LPFMKRVWSNKIDSGPPQPGLALSLRRDGPSSSKGSPHEEGGASLAQALDQVSLMPYALRLPGASVSVVRLQEGSSNGQPPPCCTATSAPLLIPAAPRAGVGGESSSPKAIHGRQSGTFLSPSDPFSSCCPVARAMPRGHGLLGALEGGPSSSRGGETNPPPRSRPT